MPFYEMSVLLRFDFVALVLCLLSVPCVQVLSLYFREPVLSSRRFLPVALFGGVRHLVLTLFSWVSPTPINSLYLFSSFYGRFLCCSPPL